MAFHTLLDAHTLHAHLHDPAWRIMDCRFALDNPQYGRQCYYESHIPGALYAHLDNDLSSPIIHGKTGRHPLPEVLTLTHSFQRWGIDTHTQVVVYDDNTGAFAGRLWWLLRWLGHTKVAVLNGGWAHWRALEYPTDDHVPVYTPTRFTANLHREKVVDAAFVLDAIHNGTHTLLDARAPERFSGAQEPIDTFGGHIPTALCAPFAQNLNTEGLFKTPIELAARFESLTQPHKPVVCYCGSGVTATHNILAMVHAGFDEPALYAGSWSEWITDAARPTTPKRDEH